MAGGDLPPRARAPPRGGPRDRGDDQRTVQPYFVLQGNIAALLATRKHVDVFLYDPLVDDPDGIITAGFEAQTGRQIAIKDVGDINGPALVAMFRQIVEHNRAGGWRKLKGP